MDRLGGGGAGWEGWGVETAARVVCCGCPIAESWELLLCVYTVNFATPYHQLWATQPLNNHRHTGAGRELWPWGGTKSCEGWLGRQLTGGDWARTTNRPKIVEQVSVCCVS